MYEITEKVNKRLQFVLAFVLTYSFIAVILFLPAHNAVKAILIVVPLGLIFLLLYKLEPLQEDNPEQKNKERISSAIMGLLHSTNGISSLQTYNRLIKASLSDEEKVLELLDCERALIDEYVLKVQSILKDISDSYRTEPESIDLLELVRQSGEFIGLKKIRYQKIPINIYQRGESFRAQLSPHLFKTAVENIIDNSYEELLSCHKEEKSIDITVDARDEYTEIAISDNGNGINGRYGVIYGDSVKPVKSLKEKGNGLGLYIACQAIAECKGLLRMFSSPDGLTTIIRIPRP